VKIRKFGYICLAAVAAAGLVAGCSSSGGAKASAGSSSTGGGAGTSSSGAGSKGTIAVGVVGAFSGALGAGEGGIPQVLSAWATQLNAAGGINGYKVKVISKDVGSVTGADVTAVKELITQDHVIAISDYDTNDSTWLPYAQSQGVPVLSPQISFGALKSSNDFPLTGSSAVLGYSVASAARTLGTKMGAAYCAEVAACNQVAQEYASIGGPLGLTLPVKVKISSSAPDYTAACQLFKSANVNSYIILGSSATQGRVVDQCYQQGLRARVVAAGASALPSWKTDKAFNNALVVDYLSPFFLDNTPAHKAYRDMLNQYLPKVVNTISDNSYAEGDWVVGQMIQAASKNITGPITAATLKAALYTLKNYTAGGLMQPVTYLPNKVNTFNCYFTWAVQNGQFVAPNGDKYVCGPQSVLGPIVKSLS
jgi:branched-chain amino acid transport system substrate-binding protein